LPGPTGPYPVGTTSLHLIDLSRPNPWTGYPPYRELMVSVWYPAQDTRRYPRAPQMLAGAAAHFGSAAGAAAQLYGVPAGTVDWAATLTSGHTNAPAAGGGPFPVVLYSPGTGEDRTWGTTLVQDLASRGYVVVTVDPTYDASEVEFPGGRVVDGVLNTQLQQAQKDGTLAALAKKIVDVRVADSRFVLNDLTALAHGGHPSRAALPAGLARRLDLGRIGMIGVSAGGFTAAQAMAEDPRIRAGIDLDGATDSPIIPGSTPAAGVHHRPAPAVHVHGRPADQLAHRGLVAVVLDPHPGLAPGPDPARGQRRERLQGRAAAAAAGRRPDWPARQRGDQGPRHRPAGPGRQRRGSVRLGLLRPLAARAGRPPAGRAVPALPADRPHSLTLHPLMPPASRAACSTVAR
jgi:dienelactone hydrolase